MNQLPDQLIEKIIDHLPTVTEVLKLKQINKRFRSIVTNLNLISLVISHQKMSLNQRWFYTYDLITSHLLKTIDYSNVQINYQMFSHLKQLLIISTDYANFEKYNLTKLFQQINRLNEIEHLELIGIKMERSNFVELNLPNLTTLNLERIEIGRITLNTPKLENLKIELSRSLENKVKFNHPESIRLLMIDFFEQVIVSFVNLEYLYVAEKLLLEEIHKIERVANQNNLFLNQFPILKELQFYMEKQTYLYLVAQKELLKKDKLQIYFCGVDLIDNDLDSLPRTDWSPYLNLSNDVIEFYKYHFDRTATVLPFVRRLIYDNLGYHINEMPDGLMNKFVNLSYFEVNDRIEDVDLFVRFLKCFNNLKTLHFENSKLNQSFFNLLPRIHPILNKLEIHTEEELDYSFILTFENLNHIYIDENMDLDFVYMIFEKFGDLKFFFNYEDAGIELNVEADRFEFNVGQGKIITFKSIDKLFAYFSEIDFEELNNCLSDNCDYDMYELESEIDYEDLDSEDVY